MNTLYYSVIMIIVSTYISENGSVCTEEIITTERVSMPEYKSYSMKEVSKEWVDAWNRLLQIKAYKAFKKYHENSLGFHYELKEASITSITLSKKWEYK